MSSAKVPFSPTKLLGSQVYQLNFLQIEDATSGTEITTWASSRLNMR